MLTDRQTGQWLLAIRDAELGQVRALTTRDLRREASYDFWRRSLELAAAAGGAPVEVFDHVIELADRRVGLTPHTLNELLVIASAAGSTRCAERLLERRASVFSSDGHKRNCLMLAARGGHMDVAIALVHAGSAIDMADNSGNTALHYAVDGLHEALIAFLRRLGADPQHRNASGDSPMSLAEGLPEILTLLEVEGGPAWYDRSARSVLFHYEKAFGLGFSPSRLDCPILYGGDYNGMMPAYPGGGEWAGQALRQYGLGWFMPFIGRLRRHEDFSLETLLGAAQRNGTAGFYRSDVP